MAVKASPEAIREMKKEISDTIKDIERINNVIKSGVSATADWNDSKATQFKELMQRVAHLTSAPIDTLNGALPKLERLAQALDQYNGINM